MSWLWLHCVKAWMIQAPTSRARDSRSSAFLCHLDPLGTRSDLAWSRCGVIVSGLRDRGFAMVCHVHQLTLRKVVNACSCRDIGSWVPDCTALEVLGLGFQHVSAVLHATRPDVAAAKSAAQKLGYAEAGFRTIREVFHRQLFRPRWCKIDSIWTQGFCQNRKSNDLRMPAIRSSQSAYQGKLHRFVLTC